MTDSLDTLAHPYPIYKKNFQTSDSPVNSQVKLEIIARAVCALRKQSLLWCGFVVNRHSAKSRQPIPASSNDSSFDRSFRLVSPSRKKSWALRICCNFRRTGARAKHVSQAPRHVTRGSEVAARGALRSRLGQKGYAKYVHVQS